MKLNLLLVFFFCSEVNQALAGIAGTKENSDPVQDTIGIFIQDYEYIDDLIHQYDSLGNYQQALETSQSGLSLARENDDNNKELAYLLKLAKYYYLIGQTEDALRHFRLYTLLKTSGIEISKNSEMMELEDAYLDEIDALMLEMNMDKALIQNLQKENERYFQGQRKILSAIKVGIGALIVILIIVLYNSFKSKKDQVKAFRQEEEDVKRLNAQVDRLEEELQRTNRELTRYKEIQKHSLSYARSIQLSLLPSGLDLPETISNSFVLYLPRGLVSGDFFAIHTNGNKTVLAVFDCPGHGVNAAHSTVVSHNLFKEIVGQGITAPSMILTMMDQKLHHEIEQMEPSREMRSGVKMAVCTLNKQTSEVEYAGAQLPIFYVHLDELHFVRGNHFPIGDPQFSDKFYSSNNLRLSTGDMIYISTDGYYSQLGGKKNKKFLRSSMINLLKSIYNHDIKEQQFILEKVHQEWKSREEQTDDILIIGMKL